MDIVEPHCPAAGSLQTTALDIVEPYRPAIGSIILIATDMVEPHGPETGSLQTTPMELFRACHFDLCMRPATARHTGSSLGDTPILIQTWF